MPLQSSGAISPLTLRPAAAADASLIATLHSRSWTSAYRGLLPDAYLDDTMPGERIAHWRETLPALLAGAGTVMVAELAGEPVGFVCLLKPDAHGSVLVDNLHALPHHKGAGIGTTLLEAAKRWTHEQGADRLHLFVLETNRPAVAFYESRGWRLAGREDDTMGGIAVVALRYDISL